MKYLIILMLFCITSAFSQKLWEIELDKNIIQVELMPDGEHFIVNYGITGENKKDMKVEVRKLIDGSIEKQILTDEFRNAYIELNTEIYFTQDFKYFMLKYSNILFDVETLKPVRTFEAILDWNGESIDIGKVQFSKDNKYVFILNRGDFDGEPVAPYFTTARSSVYIFDFQTGEFIKKIFIPYCTENIEISEDGKYLQTFQGMYQYGQYSGELVDYNFISIESLEIIKSLKPGNDFSDLGFIKNENVLYIKDYNKNYSFLDLTKDSIIFSKSLGTNESTFESELIFNETNDIFYLFFKNKNDLKIGGYLKYSYPNCNLQDEIKYFKLIDIPYSNRNLKLINNKIFLKSGTRKLFLFDLQALGLNKDSVKNEYFNKINSTISFNSQEFKGQIANIEIYNSNGSKIGNLHNGIINQPNYNFQIPELPSGAYYLQCQLPNQNLNFNFVVVK